MKNVKPKTVGEVIEILKTQDPNHICEVNYPEANERNIGQITDIDVCDGLVTIFVTDKIVLDILSKI